MAKYDLTPFERLIAMTLFPRESDFLTLKIIRDATDSLGINDEETERYKISRLDNGTVIGEKSWTVETKEIELGARAVSMIRDGLKKLDKEKKLTQEHVSLWEKAFKEEPKEQKEAADA